ncbi:hypothetical protein MCC93_11450 [Morococcus cerebrosus]|uniref:Uncharacterized protein n=1 Tax=Morococcus cerebrosus TaxID=1056807 RepID=A0A0C1EIM6_9NEIS|nr:hypothetical protein MCC93_11450 [Morococcus cerebrosus]
MNFLLLYPPNARKGRLKTNIQSFQTTPSILICHPSDG